MIALTLLKAVYCVGCNRPKIEDLESTFEHAVYVQLPGLGVFRLNPVRLVWRSCMVVIITVSRLLLAVHLVTSLWGFCFSPSASVWQMRSLHNIYGRHMRMSDMLRRSWRCCSETASMTSLLSWVSAEPHQAQPSFHLALAYQRAICTIGGH